MFNKCINLLKGVGVLLGHSCLISRERITWAYQNLRAGCDGRSEKKTKYPWQNSGKKKKEEKSKKCQIGSICTRTSIHNNTISGLL